MVLQTLCRQVHFNSEITFCVNLEKIVKFHCFLLLPEFCIFAIISYKSLKKFYETIHLKSCSLVNNVAHRFRLSSQVFYKACFEFPTIIILCSTIL